MDVKRFSPRQNCDRRAAARDRSHASLDAIWSDEEARFYADALATSDYAARIGTTLRLLIGTPSSLLDIGAGSGVLGRDFAAADGRWTAVEPNRYLASLLERHPKRRPDWVIRDRWQNLGVHEALVHETVLAANMGGPIEDAAAFVKAMRPLAQRFLCWSIPAQRGPRRFCLSDFLPSDIHGEDETPGVDIAFERLGAALAPDSVTHVRWTFRAAFPDPGAAEAHFARQFGIVDAGARRELRAWLAARLKPGMGGWIAAVPKVTAILLWWK